MANIKNVRRRKPNTPRTGAAAAARGSTSSSNKRRRVAPVRPNSESPSLEAPLASTPPPPRSPTPDRNVSMSPPPGLDEIPPGYVGLTQDGKVVGFTEEEWYFHDQERVLQTIGYVDGDNKEEERMVLVIGDDGKVERRPVTPVGKLNPEIPALVDKSLYLGFLQEPGMLVGGRSEVLWGAGQTASDAKAEGAATVKSTVIASKGCEWESWINWDGNMSGDCT